MTAAALLAAGAGCAVWASRVEHGPPGWRSGVAFGLLVLGAVETGRKGLKR